MADMPVIVGVHRSGPILLRIVLDAQQDLRVSPGTGFLIQAVAWLEQPDACCIDVAERVAGRILCVPIHPALQANQQERVVHALLAALA